MKIYSACFVSISVLLFLAGCKQPHLIRPNQPTKQPLAQAPVCPPEAKRPPRFLTLEELAIAKEYYLAIDNKEMAINYVEEMIKKSSSPEQLEQLKIELADLYFDLGKFEEASKFYTLYLSLYPGSKYRVYAHYQAILCRFYTSLSCDRDQTTTQEALALTQNYVKQAEHDPEAYQEYFNDVMNIQGLCCNKLYESDLNIFNFYLNKGSVKACQIHCEEMKKRFGSFTNNDIQLKLLALECTMAELTNDTELLALKKAELDRRTPHATLTLAQNTPTQNKSVTRF